MATRLTRTEQQARTRAALLDAAGRVFVERGFHGASVEAITLEAGYSRGAFYSNFSSKEELFAELVQDRVYSVYRQLATESLDPATRPSPRQVGEIAGAMNGLPDARWMTRLWLELMANAGRDEAFRKIVARFWTENRAIGALALASAYEEAGRKPPVPPEHIVTAMTALDIGLALQHYADPDAVPLDLYPELFELLFGPLEPGRR
jgi:AcrR family transcriptional regulator